MPKQGIPVLNLQSTMALCQKEEVRQSICTKKYKIEEPVLTYTGIVGLHSNFFLGAVNQ